MNAPAPVLVRLPDAPALRQMFHLRYGREAQLGWGPRLRRDYGYHTPDDEIDKVDFGKLQHQDATIDATVAALADGSVTPSFRATPAGVSA